MVLPFVKIGTLALRTLAKPIANRLKQQAGIHPRFRQFIVNLAQVNHRFTTTIQRRIHSHAMDVEIRPLNEEKAVQAAADLIGELFIFTVAGAAIIFEVQRNARAEAKKEELRKQELEAIKSKQEELVMETEQLMLKLKELEQLTRKHGLLGLFNFQLSQTHENQ